MAITADRKTDSLATGFTLALTGVPGVHDFYPGGMLMLGTDDGFIKPMSASVAAVGVGVCTQRLAATAITAGSSSISYESGIHNFANSTSTDQITSKEIGKLCFGVSDVQVAKTSNSNARAIAGRVHAVLSNGTVDVLTYVPLHPSGSTV